MMQAGPDFFLLNSRLRNFIQVMNQIRLSRRSSTRLRDSGLNWMLKYQDTSCFFFPFPSFLIMFSSSFFSIHLDLLHFFFKPTFISTLFNLSCLSTDGLSSWSHSPAPSDLSSHPTLFKPSFESLKIQLLPK